jgi:hypothetical protein
MLNVKWMGFRRQVDGTRSNKLFILFHTDTTLIDTPIDPVASPVETLLPFVVSSLFVCLSFVSRSLYTKKRRQTSGLSANRHIWLFGSDESHQRECQRFLSRLFFVLIQHAHVRVGFSDYRSFWYMPLSIIGSFPFILQLYFLFYIIDSPFYISILHKYNRIYFVVYCRTFFYDP